MPFLLVAHDKADALPRRMEVRQAHLDKLAPLKVTGDVLYAAVLLNDKGDLAGSMIVFNFDDRAAVDEYLKTEPYIANDVWGDIKITACRPAPLAAK